MRNAQQTQMNLKHCLTNHRAITFMRKKLKTDAQQTTQPLHSYAKNKTKTPSNPLGHYTRTINQCFGNVWMMFG